MLLWSRGNGIKKKKLQAPRTQDKLIMSNYYLSINGIWMSVANFVFICMKQGNT